MHHGQLLLLTLDKANLRGRRILCVCVYICHVRSTCTNSDWWHTCIYTYCRIVSLERVCNGLGKILFCSGTHGCRRIHATWTLIAWQRCLLRLRYICVCVHIYTLLRLLMHVLLCKYILFRTGSLAGRAARRCRTRSWWAARAWSSRLGGRTGRARIMTSSSKS